MTEVSDSLTIFRIGLVALGLGEQKQIFDRLPDAYQAALWQDRLREGIEAVCDRGQKAALSDLRERLRPESYSDQKKNKASVAYIDKMERRLEQLFPDFTVLQKYTHYLGDDSCRSQVIQQGGGALPSCVCLSSDSGALRGNPCGALMQCRAGGCAPTRWGCGFLWLQGCDGLCTGRFGR
jgi:hypothetical protein